MVLVISFRIILPTIRGPLLGSVLAFNLKQKKESILIYTNNSNCRPEAIVQFSKSNQTNYLCTVLLMLIESWDSAKHYHSSPGHKNNIQQVRTSEEKTQDILYDDKFIHRELNKV